VSCGSYQITEQREQVNSASVVLRLHCKACRQDLIFWTGTLAEERRFKKHRRKLSRRLGFQ
jgi:hypothetical protein